MADFAASSRPSIRLATPADASALARLRLDFRAELGAVVEDEGAFVARCMEWMAVRLDDDAQWLCWVAEEGGMLLGTLWLQRVEKLPNPVGEPEQHAYVSSVYVLPERRDAGVGALLLEVALAWCREHEVDAVLLWPSARSRSFYARYGFAPREDLFGLRLAGSSE